MATYFEQVLCFGLLFKHGLQHVVDLLWRGILAITCPYAGDQDEFLHPRLCRLSYQVDVALQESIQTVFTSIATSMSKSKWQANKLS